MAKRFKSSGIAPLLILFVFIMTLATRLFNLTSGSSVDEIFMKTIVAQIVIFALPALFYIRTRDDKYFSNINVSAMIPSKTLFLIYTLAIFFQVFIAYFNTLDTVFHTLKLDREPAVVALFL